MQRWKLGGAGGWDYLTLDSATHRLFISRATRVDVVDTQSGQVVGTIADTQGVHGIALAPDLHRGFTSNGKGDSITVFDLDSLKTIQEVKISAHNPDAILYEPSGKHVFTFNGKSKDVTVLDASTLAVVATIPVPDKPEFAVDDHAGQIFVNIESEPGQMVVIDSRKLAVKATWPLAGCDSPSGLAMDRVHHRLFSVCDDKVMAVTNAENGSGVARVPIGEGPDAAAFDEKRSLVLSSNGEGNLTRRPRGVPRSLPGRRDGEDTAWRSHHGARSGQRQGISRHRGVHAGAGADSRAAASATCPGPRYIHGAGGG